MTRKEFIFMKRLKGNYMFVPRIFWWSTYEKNNDGKLKKYYNLSVHAKWLYITLKELEHKYTGTYNNEDYCRENGFLNDKNVFYVDMDRLAAFSNLSLSTVRRSKKELEEVGLIKTVSPKITGKKVTAYRLTDGIDFDEVAFIEMKPYAEKTKKRDIRTLKKSISRQEKRDGFIYVMKNCGYYKIGKSIDCHRLGEYTKLPEDPEYVIIEYVHFMDEIEKLIHKSFASKRKRGGSCEWFELTDEDIQKIRNFLKRYTIECTDTKWYDEYVKLKNSCCS